MKKKTKRIFSLLLVLMLLFGMIYTAALSELSRMPRNLRINCFVFIANTILQGLLTIVVHIGGYCE